MKRLTIMAQAFQDAGIKTNLIRYGFKGHTVSMESNYALSYKTAMKLKADGIID